ncbi:nucleoside phosphorylase domain-containing protein [Trichoderma pleuroticola]
MASGDSEREFVNDDYTVGWICAITIEHVAARVFLDEEHKLPDHVSTNDDNNYVLGRIGKHNIVIAVLPYGEYGLSSAASVARDMLHTFPNIRIGLMVGIGGGAPTEKHDIRLGDVVVSVSRDGKGSVFQYDFDDTIQSQTFKETGFLNQTPTILRTAVSGLESHYEIEEHQIRKTIDGIFNKKPHLRKKYNRPNPATDRLYLSSIIHPPTEGMNCSAHCGNGAPNLIVRSKRDSDEDDPIIHYGLIASSTQLMRDAVIRDKLAAEREILCFETEAAGLMNHFPCLVIRGICDYADTHTNTEWRSYAAMAAAAYAKDLLCRIPPNRVEALKRMDVFTDISEGISGLLQAQKSERRDDILNWLSPTNYASQQYDYSRNRQRGTGQWLVDSKQYQTWLSKPGEALFCQGIPGAGKTVLVSMAIDQITTKFQNDMDTGIAYIYFDYRQKEEHAELLLRNLLKQLAQRRPSLPACVSTLYKQGIDQGISPSLEAISLAFKRWLATIRKFSSSLMRLMSLRIPVAINS